MVDDKIVRSWGYAMALRLGNADRMELPAVAVLENVWGLPLKQIADYIGVSRPFLSRCCRRSMTPDGVMAPEKQLPVERYRLAVELLAKVLEAARDRAEEVKKSNNPGDIILRTAVKECARVVTAELGRIQELEEAKTRTYTPRSHRETRTAPQQEARP